MTRDITDRLSLFAEEPIEVRRIALNMDQVREYGSPPNPAKVTDARFAGYERIHGRESWELDALDPTVINDLITENVREFRYEKDWRIAVAKEKRHRDDLGIASDRWSEVTEFLNG